MLNETINGAVNATVATTNNSSFSIFLSDPVNQVMFTILLAMGGFVIFIMICQLVSRIFGSGRGFTQIYLPFKKIDSYTSRDNPYKRYVGIEIECLNRDRGKNCFVEEELQEFHVDQGEDASLSSGGIEFKTHPIRGKQLIENNYNFCNELIKRGYYTNSSCGLHIHLEVDKSNLKLLKNIYLFYQKYEEQFFKMLPRSRQNSGFCKKFKSIYQYNYKDVYNALSKINTCNKFKEFIYETENWGIKEDQHGNKKRYCWINMHSIFYRGTLEIRAHSGTINPEKINNWILMHLRILDMLEDMSLDDVERLDPSSTKFLSLFNARLKDYINLRWSKFHNVWREEYGKDYNKTGYGKERNKNYLEKVMKSSEKNGGENNKEDNKSFLGPY